jgi:hypothetical protein
MNAIVNKFAGTCRVCDGRVPAGAGKCEKIDGRWQVQCAAPCQPAPRAQAPVASRVGDLSGILALFAKAKTHLKFPAIVLSVGSQQVRINVSGERAKFPGSLRVMSAERDGEGERDWLGRITLDGTFEGSRAASAFFPELLAKLRAFSADPARVAGEDGRLHGRCCFCRIALSDERSTAVGYGGTCAKHYGLPWGERPVEFAAAPGESIDAAMQLLEAAGDRAQTARDERAKQKAREYAEEWGHLSHGVAL